MQVSIRETADVNVRYQEDRQPGRSGARTRPALKF
jgi:hypothetical protein